MIHLISLKTISDCKQWRSTTTSLFNTCLPPPSSSSFGIVLATHVSVISLESAVCILALKYSILREEAALELFGSPLEVEGTGSVLEVEGEGSALGVSVTGLLCCKVLHFPSNVCLRLRFLNMCTSMNIGVFHAVFRFKAIFCSTN